MTIETRVHEATEEARAEQLAQRLLGQFSAGIELLTVELGRRLGLYEVLWASGAVTAVELAAGAAVAERYATEWLDQQAAAGIVEIVGSDVLTRAPRFRLPAGHAAVLVDRDSAAYLLGVAPLLMAVARTAPAVADAFATARGVEYADFGDELRFGFAEVNRPGFLLGMRSWVETLPDVTERLDRGGIILDAGAGEGWSTIGLARAFPAATVVGFDLDERSVEAARRNVAGAGLEDRVRIVRANAADASALRVAVDGPVTLVTVFQALHDMGQPVRALAAFRGLLADGGAVLVGDEHGEDVKAAPADEVERMKLAMSVLQCLPATWAESDAVLNGTVLRGHTIGSWVREAGFESHEVLDIEHPFWRFYRVG
jgi:ubiquinone/menaquinone biosynthesis C-methylase UbiE